MSRSPATLARLGSTAAAFLTCISLGGIATVAHAKPFEDYIKPMPTVAPLSSASWGTAALPRDLSNGIESAMGAGVHPQWYYWDGQIIKAQDGKYHMFMSTFDANTNFGTGWLNSDAYHAVSDTNVLGPYVRKDYVYSTGGSTPHKGHNVSAVELPDGTYAVIVSEVVPFQIFKSSSLDGPWTGCSPQSDIGASNISMFPRHDGKFQITERNGRIAIADTLCGHYVKQTPTLAYTPNPTDAQGNPVSGTIYAKRTSIPGVSNPGYIWQEDPHIWRSGGVYHVIYSGSGDRVGWHVYSQDGINDWQDNGYAWSPREYERLFCYEGTSTCNQWYKMERPGVVLEDGHPTHITWAVSDVDKDYDVLPGTNHGTKIIVVPFDGVTFDADFGDGTVGGAPGEGGTSGTGGTGAGGDTSGGTAGATSGGAAGAAVGGATSGGVMGNTGGTTANTGGATTTGGTMASGGRSGSSSTSGGSGVTGGSSNFSGGSAGLASGGALGSGGSSPLGGATAGSSGGSSSGAPAGGGIGGGSSEPSGTDETSSSSGCGCVVGADSRYGAFASSLLLAALGILSSRRRRSR